MMNRSLSTARWALPALTGMLLAACGGGDAPEAGAAPGSAAAPTAQAPAAPAAPAAASRGGPVTEPEIRSHRLTLDRIRAVYQAEIEWKRAGGRMEDDESGETGDDMSAAAGANEALRQIEAKPDLVEVLRRHGLSPREAAIEMMVFGVSSIAAATGDATYTAMVAPENVEFVRTHQAELQRLEQAKEAADAQTGS